MAEFNTKCIHIIECKVIPRSSMNALKWDTDLGLWKVYINAAPEKGKANNAVCKLFAECLRLSSSSVCVSKGLVTPRKWIQVVCSFDRVELDARLHVKSV